MWKRESILGELINCDMKAKQIVTNEGLISVIIPVYNGELYLKEAIDSALQQTYPHVEIIVVDDGSTDRSWEIIESYGDQINGIKLENNQGGCAARNRGFEISRGQFLMFLDSDDLIASDTLDALSKTIGRRSDCLGLCKWFFLNYAENKWGKNKPPSSLTPPNGDYIRGWLTDWCVPPCAILWPRRLFEVIGGWDENLRARQDFDIMMRAHLHGAPVVIAQGGQSYYRLHGDLKISVAWDRSDVAVRSRIRVLEKVEQRLKEIGIFSEYQEALGIAYHLLGKSLVYANSAHCHECLRRADLLAGRKSYYGTRMHRLLCHILGPEGKIRFANWTGKYGLNPYRWQNR